MQSVIMLFESEKLTPEGRISTLKRLFQETVRRPGQSPRPGHVPVPVLEAHGEYTTPVRYMIEAAEKQCRDKERMRAIRKVNRLLDTLPALMEHALVTGPDGDWLRFYRTLSQIHSLLEDAELGLEPEEFASLTRKLIAFAGAVADASVLRIDGASTFALLLTQLMLHKHAPKRKKKRPHSKKPAPQPRKNPQNP